MTRVLRVAALFTAYSAIGFGGDYAAGLLAQARSGDDGPVRLHEAARPEVDVVVDVEVRRSGRCAHASTSETTIPIDGARLLEIRAGAGALRVEGRSGLDEIAVTSSACASSEALLRELTLAIDRGGERVTVVTEYPSGGGRGGTARTDLTVLVPSGFAVEIDDSSGEMEVSGTGALSIRDSSGSIRVRGVNGSVRIDDSSGGLVIEGVDGDVSIDDGSGGIELTGVAGSVSIEDGSGGIDVEGVASDVHVRSDGSGSIAVRGVGGDFRVDRDGSGGIRYSDVAGTVDVPEDRRRRRSRPEG